MRLADPTGDALVHLDLDAAGSAGTPVTWGVAPVRCAADVCTQALQSFTASGSPEWTIDTAGYDVVDVVLVPITPTYTLDETFGYAVRFDAAPKRRDPNQIGSRAVHYPTSCDSPAPGPGSRGL